MAGIAILTSLILTAKPAALGGSVASIYVTAPRLVATVSLDAAAGVLLYRWSAVFGRWVSVQDGAYSVAAGVTETRWEPWAAGYYCLVRTSGSGVGTWAAEGL